MSPRGGTRGRALLLLEDLGGGTGNHVCRVAAQWAARGWEVVIVTPTAPLVRELPFGVEIRVMPGAKWFDRFPLAQARRLLQVRRMVRELRPDVVHTYFFWSIVYGRILRLFGQIPALVENREDMGFSWGRGAYRVLRMTRGIPDRFICVAGAVRDVMLDRESVDPGRARVVRNGIESAVERSVTRADARRALGFSDEHIVVGMVANLPRAVKGGSRLLDSVSAIVAEIPSARFLLVGLGTDRESLEKELEVRGIARHVVGAGYRRDVDTCYAAMDISVLTSSTEGLSITLLESMRAGLPTVVTRVGGNPEIVDDGVTGFLVDVDDTQAFADRVIALARDASLRQAMGDAGRRRVIRHFTLEAVAKSYLDIYQELLEVPASRHAAGPGLSRSGEGNT